MLFTLCNHSFSKHSTGRTAFFSPYQHFIAHQGKNFRVPDYAGDTELIAGTLRVYCYWSLTPATNYS